jgi:hypothetical protein
MLPEIKRGLARLRDGNQLIPVLLDDIFPAFAIPDRLRRGRAANAAGQGPADRAQRRHHRAARNLRPGNTTGGGAGSGGERAIRADHHRPHADNYPTLHSRLHLRGIGGVSVGGIALMASGEDEREESREQDEG